MPNFHVPIGNGVLWLVLRFLAVRRNQQCSWSGKRKNAYGSEFYVPGTSAVNSDRCDKFGGYNKLNRLQKRTGFHKTDQTAY